MIKKCKLSKDFKFRVGLDDSNFRKGGLAKIDKETGIVHFFPAKFPSKNFSTFIKPSPNYFFTDEQIIDIIKKYTTHDSWYCSKINLLLAADSQDLKDHSDYIKELRWCIEKLAKIYPIRENKVFRGYECSLEEFEAYKLKENLYIPSFLSSSKNQKKFYQAENHNTLMVINFNYVPNNAFVVGEKFSIYAEKEEEVLFACYAKFRVVDKKKEFVFNNKKYEFYIEMEHINEAKEMDENVKKMACFNFFFN